MVSNELLSFPEENKTWNENKIEIKKKTTSTCVCEWVVKVDEKKEKKKRKLSPLQIWELENKNLKLEIIELEKNSLSLSSTYKVSATKPMSDSVDLNLNPTKFAQQQNIADYFDISTVNCNYYLPSFLPQRHTYKHSLKQNKQETLVVPIVLLVWRLWVCVRVAIVPSSKEEFKESNRSAGNSSLIIQNNNKKKHHHPKGNDFAENINTKTNQQKQSATKRVAATNCNL